MTAEREKEDVTSRIKMTESFHHAITGAVKQHSLLGRLRHQLHLRSEMKRLSFTKQLNFRGTFGGKIQNQTHLQNEIFESAGPAAAAITYFKSS